MAASMPIYEYRRPDGSTFEILQAFTDEPLSQDPKTGAPVERVLHAPAVHFKGKGFYNTDYGTRKRQRETSASDDSNGSPGSSGGGSSGSSEGGSSENGSSREGSAGASTDGSSPKGTTASKGKKETAAKPERAVAGSSG
jgi:putative FmdB family regulatory protein